MWEHHPVEFPLSKPYESEYILYHPSKNNIIVRDSDFVIPDIYNYDTRQLVSFESEGELENAYGGNHQRVTDVESFKIPINNPGQSANKVNKELLTSLNIDIINIFT